MRARNVSARKLLLTVALVAVTAGACSSSSKTADSSTTPTTPATSPSDAGTPTTSAGTPTTEAPKSYSGSSSSAFCNLARTDKATFNDNADIATKTPADLKALYAKLIPALEQARDIAPSAIKTDFETYVTSIKNIEAAFAAAQYNFENLDPSKLQGFNTPALATAAGHLQQYFTQVCHIAPTPTPTTTPTT